MHEIGNYCNCWSFACKLLREGVMAWLDEPHAAQGPKYWGFELPIHTKSASIWVSETHDTWNSAVFVGVCSAWTFTAKCQRWQDLGDQSSSICDHMKAVVKCVLNLNSMIIIMYFVAVCSRWRRFFCRRFFARARIKTCVAFESQPCLNCCRRKKRQQRR